MNVALGAVIIFILLLPPITFYLAYSFGRFPKAGPTITVPEGLMISAIFAVFVHAVATYFIPAEIRFDALVYLIGGDLKSLKTTYPTSKLANYSGSLLSIIFAY